MINQLHTWKGSVEIDGTFYNNISEADLSKISSNSHIKLHNLNKNTISAKIQSEKAIVESSNLIKETSGLVRIKVKKYMTQKSNPGFDFMLKWNNDNPMPMRIMIGEKLQETRGMVKMNLHADILAEKTYTCMKCGRILTNPVSQFFGIGPECGGHNYTHPFDTDEELRNAVANYRKELQKITWTGWVIKSAIEEEEVM